MTSIRGPLQVQSTYGTYDASCHTASTDSSSSDDASPSKHEKKLLQGRRRSSMSRSSGRDMIMNLIAKEMTSTFLEDEEEIGSDANPSGSPGAMSAEDLFYAQMNGEAIDLGTSTHDLGPSRSNLDRSAEGLDFDDDGSFGALTIPDDIRTETADHEATRRRSSIESASKTSSRGKSSSKGSISKKSARSGSSKKSVRSESSHTNSSTEETLSIEEIQDYVMKNMPVEVRDKIPKEAWAQIFGKSLPGKTRRKKSMKSTKVEKAEDDSSVISDITEVTTHPGEITESAFEERDLKPEEVDWDEEVCPGLEISRRVSETDTKSRTSGSSQGSVSQRCLIDPTGAIRCHTEGQKKISFSFVEVRYYERVLEINPSVTNGPAIGIGWRFKRGGQIDVDDFELQRGGAGRRNNELILPRPFREKILKDAGYDQKQIAEAVRIIRKAKDRRKVTVQNLGSGAEAIEETVEAASRRIMGILTFGAKRGLVKSY